MPKKRIQEEKLPIVLPEDTELYSECRKIDDSLWLHLCHEIHCLHVKVNTNIFFEPTLPEIFGSSQVI